MEISIAHGMHITEAARYLTTKEPTVLTLDCRPFMLFNEGHVNSACNIHCPPILKRRSGGFIALENIVPCETKRRLLQSGHYAAVVVYDADTVELSDASKDSNLYSVLKSLPQQVDINEISYIIGGYEAFKQEFPHLCVGHSIPHVVPSSAPLEPSSSSQSTKGDPVEILAHLYLGNYHQASQKELLQRLGITAILNVSTTCKNQFEDDFMYKTIPVDDTDSANLSCWFYEAIDTIESVKDNGGRVLVHCQAGVSRSATICLAYLMYTSRLGLEAAYEHIKSRRSVIAPNLNFMQQLKEFEQQLTAAHSLAPSSEPMSSFSFIDADLETDSSSSNFDTTFDFSFSFRDIASPVMTPVTPLLSPS